MKYLLLIVLCTGLAAADNRATAERHFRAGAKAYAASSFEAAAAHFEVAYKALPLPEIAFSTAQAYRKLYRVDRKPQHVKRAVELYRVYLDKVKKGGRVGDAVDNLAEMERELARFGSQKIEAAPAVERTRIGVHVSLAGQVADAVREVGELPGAATIEGLVTKLDGKAIEPYALIEVSPGDHVIEVAAPGYFPVEKKQRAVQGATALVEVELVPQPANVTVKTEEGARIAVDGRGVPSSTFTLPAGKHLVTVTRSGREPFGREITVARGQTVKLDAPLAKTARRKAVPWVLGGAGVLAALSVTSIALAIHENSTANDLDDDIKRGNADPTTADAFDAAVAARDDYKTGAWVLGGAAVVAGTVGVLLYAFDSPSAESVRVAPTIGTNGAGITAAGRF